MESSEELLRLLNSLERATHMTKCLPCANSPDQVSAFYDSLREAQLHINNFLLQQQQQQQRSPETNERAMHENGGTNPSNETLDMDQPMQGDHEEEEEEVEKLQESSADRCALYSKRRKRAQPIEDDRLRYMFSQHHQKPAFDPQERQRTLDLIFQFHE